ncbi:MAG TPA: hypothetical protein VFG57_04105 [Gaiella sp.]|jgi:hypothetical protein|nr:hypothetical protein [Gaiella sp.]
MSRATSLAVVALTLVLVPAPAGAGTTRPPLGLTVTPARVALAGTGKASVRITNPGRGAVVVDVGRAGFSLDLRGRPRVVARAAPRAATAWLTVQPGHFVLPAGASKWLTVSSRLPGRAEPGDHDALVLFTTRPRRSAGVAVRMRIGVVVVVRAPGRVVRSVAIRALRVRRAGRTRTLELVLANRGNVTESIDAVRVRVLLVRKGARASVRAETRALRPRTNGVVQFRYRGRLAGWITARVRLTLEPGRPALSRTFRVKL